MTKSAVGLASDLCRTYVGPLAVVFLAGFGLGAPAQAGAWEEFERRCLVPMENVVLSLPEDLTADVQEYDHVHSFQLPKDELILELRLDKSSDTDRCSVKRTVGGEQPVENVRDQFEAWVELAERALRYNQIDLGDGSWAYRSTQWREPKMDVIMRLDESHQGFYLSAEETDLES